MTSAACQATSAPASASSSLAMRDVQAIADAILCLVETAHGDNIPCVYPDSWISMEVHGYDGALPESIRGSSVHQVGEVSRSSFSAESRELRLVLYVINVTPTRITFRSETNQGIFYGVHFDGIAERSADKWKFSWDPSWQRPG
jgi:hypothetical protein